MKRIWKDKRGQEAKFWAFGLIALLIFGAIWQSGLLAKAGNLFSVSPGSKPSDFSDAACDENGQTTLTLSVQNTLNKTGTETYDMGVRLVSSDGEIYSGTDTTSGSYTVNCPADLTVKGLSASGANGDAAKFASVLSGDASVESDGDAVIRIRKPTQSVTLGGYSHGVLEVRAKDVINDGFLFDDQDNSATDYETDGVKFNGTSSGDENIAVGSGAELHIQQFVRPTVDDNIWGDIGGYYILVNAATTKWNEPTVKLNGVVLSDVKDQLNPDEAKAYNAYEYVYLANKHIERTAEATVDFSIFALSGVDPAGTDDIDIDYASRGAYASTTNSNNVKIGAVKDDSSQTQVHTLIDTTQAVS